MESEMKFSNEKNRKDIIHCRFCYNYLICLCSISQKTFLGTNHQTTTKKVKKLKKKTPHKVTWGYPFERLYHKNIKFKSGQKFGETDILRRPDKKSYFHDGYDFGFSEVGHSPVLAVHEGTVHKVKYRPGMGLYVWIISKDGYVEIYQEGF